MVQKNEMSARALTMAELENVNGGRPMFQGGYFKSIKETIKKFKTAIDVEKFLIRGIKVRDSLICSPKMRIEKRKSVAGSVSSFLGF